MNIKAERRPNGHPIAIPVIDTLNLEISALLLLHADVLEAIRTMEPAWEKVSQSKFRLVKYKDANGEMRPMYQLSKTE